MGKEITGQPPAQPIVQPPSVKKTAEISSDLVKASKGASNFVVEGRGKSLLGAGKPREYSKSPPQDSKRVYETVTPLILPNGK
jgi:hypothetical protein